MHDPFSRFVGPMYRECMVMQGCVKLLFEVYSSTTWIIHPAAAMPTLPVLPPRDQSNPQHEATQSAQITARQEVVCWTLHVSISEQDVEYINKVK